MFVTQAGTKGPQQGSEVPQLPLGGGIESIPHQSRINGSIQIKHHRTQIVQEVCCFNQNRPVRHLGNVVNLFLFSQIPGLSFIPTPTLILGHLKDQFQYPGTYGLFDRPPPIGIGNVLQIVMEQGRGQDLITGAEASEDTDYANQMGDIGDALLIQGVPTRLTGRRLDSPLAKLMEMPSSRQSRGILKHARKQGSVRLNGDSHRIIVTGVARSGHAGQVH